MRNGTSIGSAESLVEAILRLERGIEEAMRATTDNGRMTVDARTIARIIGLIRCYGGREGWRADDKSIAQLPPGPRNYIEGLHHELARLQRHNARLWAGERSQTPPAEYAALIDPIATQIDYAAFFSNAHLMPDVKQRRTAARDMARSIVNLLVKRRALVELAPLAEQR